MMFRTKYVVVLLIAVLAARCASVGKTTLQPSISPDTAQAMLSAAQKIPAGSRIAVGLADGKRFKAVLLAVNEREVVVQRRTRLAEAPIRIDPADLTCLELDAPRDGFGKMIAIGAAIGAGVTLAFLAVLAATLSD